MSGRTPTWVLPGMLVGVILGGLLGFYLPDVMLSASFVGKLFTNALRMLVIPLLVGTLIVGIGQIADNRRLGQISGMALVYYLGTTLLAAIVAVVTVSLLSPGVGANLVGLDSMPNLPSAGGRSLTGILGSIFPENIIRAIIEGQYLAIAVFAGLLGVALTWLASRGRSVVSFFMEVNDALIRLVSFVMYAAPVGLLFLMGGVVANSRSSFGEMAGTLGMYTLTIVAVLLVIGAVIFPLIFIAVTKRSLGSYLNNMSTALTTAFATSSSATAYPITYDAVIDTNRVDSKVASVVLPMGLGLNMAATAAYLVVATVFAAQAFGVDLPWPNLILLVLTSCVVSLGTPGMPSAGFLLLTTTFTIAGLPPQALVATGMIFAVDWLVDRLRSTVNVCGDATAAAVVADGVEEMRSTSRSTIGRSQAGRERTGRPAESRDSREDRFAARRGGRFGRPDQRPGRDRVERPDRSERPERAERPERGDRGDRPERGDRGDRRPGSRPRFDERPRDRQERTRPSPFEMPASTMPALDEQPSAPEISKPDRPEPVDRPAMSERSEPRNVPERGESKERPDRSDRPERPERPERSDREPRRDRYDRRGRGRFGDRDRGGRPDGTEGGGPRPPRAPYVRESSGATAPGEMEDPSIEVKPESFEPAESPRASEPAPLAETLRPIRPTEPTETAVPTPPQSRRPFERSEPARTSEQEGARESTSNESTQQEGSQEWGRGVKRRGRMVGGEHSAEETPATPTPEPTSSFSAENIEFGGRGRKRKPIV